MNIQGCSEKSDNTEPIFVGKKDLQRAIQKAKLLTHVPKKKSTEKFRCSKLIIVKYIISPKPSQSLQEICLWSQEPISKQRTGTEHSSHRKIRK